MRSLIPKYAKKYPTAARIPPIFAPLTLCVMVHLDNSAIAFRYKDDRQLNTAYRLFKAMSVPFMASVGKGLMRLALSLRLPVTGLFRATIFRQFCGGESLQECLGSVSTLHKFNVMSYITYAAEGKENQTEFERSVKELVRVISSIKDQPAIPFAVFKITSMASYDFLEKVSSGVQLTEAEQKEWEAVRRRVDAVCKAASDAGKPINVDAEETWIQPALDQLTEEMMAKYNRERTLVFNTFQMYRKDRLAFLRTSWEKANREGYHFGAKLVRGAYMEKERVRAEQMGHPSPIHDTKEDTDKAYDEAVRFCLDHLEGNLLLMGTHNANSITKLTEEMEKRNISKEDPRIFTAQLLGMSDNITFNMANEGYHSVKYVPFGPIREVIPYLLRRADENSSVQDQTGRELHLLEKEIQRRKTEHK